MDRRFGRRYAPDARDQRYPMRKAIRRAPISLPVIWQIGPVLDQGATPQCVAYSCANWLSCAPVVTIVDTPAYEQALYDRARQVDEWPGEDYEGTSVRAGFKVLQEQGHLPNYVWAQSEQDIWDFVTTTGPVVMGTDWYDGMSDPDGSGFLNPLGGIVGGHAWLIYGADQTFYYMQNSWGPWGIGNSGTAKIRRPDVAFLLDAQGEAGAGSEVPITPDPPPPPAPDKPGCFGVLVASVLGGAGLAYALIRLLG
jgi:hypothetical protein